MTDEKQEVAVCVTCLVDQMMPEIGLATVKLLKRAGYDVVFPEAQTCCGQPFFNSGYRAEAARLARRTIEIFEPYELVVLPSGSCTTMIRVEYPHLFQDLPEWYERARRLADKTYELSEFLHDQAGWTPAAAADAPTITYHDSCHMRRSLNLGKEPRALLSAAGCRLVEMREADRCCGFGGLFSLKMPEISNAMTGEKLEQAAETAAGCLVTSDPGCLMQMRGLAGAGQQVEHVATVLERISR